MRLLCNWFIISNRKDFGAISCKITALSLVTNSRNSNPSLRRNWSHCLNNVTNSWFGLWMTGFALYCSGRQIAMVMVSSSVCSCYIICGVHCSSQLESTVAKFSVLLPSELGVKFSWRVRALTTCLSTVLVYCGQSVRLHWRVGFLDKASALPWTEPRRCLISKS